MNAEFLAKIIPNTAIHAKWLNSIAFLEHVGSRKLIKSQDSQYLDSEMLDHIAEETRHAAFLKKILKRNFPDQCPNFEQQYLLGDPEKYFQDLDSFISEDILKSYSDEKKITYAYVTLLIEERALNVYDQYQTALNNYGISIRLNSIVKEEENHLSAMHSILALDSPEGQKRWSLYKTMENKFFADLIRRIEIDIEESTLDECIKKDLASLHTDGARSANL